jgi:hypothetical protein
VTPDNDPLDFADDAIVVVILKAANLIARFGATPPNMNAAPISAGSEVARAAISGSI